jgi:hypothetical protein
MRHFRTALLLLLLSGCVYVPGVMWRRAEENRSRVTRIALGQSIDEVRTIMGKDPEKREARVRFDGKKVELWTYVTDYTRKVDSTIIFLDGKVQEIRATSWCEAD